MVEGKTFRGSCHTANKAKAVQYEAKVKSEIYNKVYLESDREHITVREAVKRFMKDNSTALQKNHDFLQRKVFGESKKGTKLFGLQARITIDKLSERDLQELITARREEGFSNSIILHELVFINQVILHARRLGFRVPQINMSDLKKANRVQPAKSPIRYLSPEEETNLIKELSRTVEGSAAAHTNLQRIDTMQFTVLLLDLGCRYGELANMKWDQVDLESGFIRVWRSKVKNESVLLVTDRVRSILEDRLKVKHPEQIYIFENSRGGPRNHIRGAFQSACDRAGIEGISWHKLRHTFASKLVQSGISLYYVQQLLGHANVSTTERYAHLAPSLAATQAAAILNNLNQANLQVNI
jgi:integrase